MRFIKAILDQRNIFVCIKYASEDCLRGRSLALLSCFHQDKPAHRHQAEKQVCVSRMTSSAPCPLAAQLRLFLLEGCCQDHKNRFTWEATSINNYKTQHHFDTSTDVSAQFQWYRVARLSSFQERVGNRMLDFLRHVKIVIQSLRKIAAKNFFLKIDISIGIFFETERHRFLKTNILRNISWWIYFSLLRPIPLTKVLPYEVSKETMVQFRILHVCFHDSFYLINHRWPCFFCSTLLCVLSVWSLISFISLCWSRFYYGRCYGCGNYKKSCHELEHFAR